MADTTRLTEVIEPLAAALGFDLVRVKLSGQGEERTLQIMAEDPATGQLVVEQCMALSRSISAEIDSLEEAGEDLVVGAYNLEVSSPGIDRPLTREKDFANWAGHEANFSLSQPVDDHRKLRGTLVGIEDGIVTVEDKKAGRVAVPLAHIHSAKLVLTNALIAATRPLDMSGADEVEEIIEDTLEEEKADD
ncbi:ribosome maturation protein RimP [Altererythrobacter xixiisoli]|uniref:Ribosome maturation factor RimP n=1 Tax=Croceibacterium xixiisoli TaxID=1476466 RepID=A0A6I4TTU4_9SPHN|nr:ribosome maturation protein RimP [Croceibacterium xixiisoli]MXO98287.1 ribosome maturation protein RimP [Croceibacterium xixiisoli]